MADKKQTKRQPQKQDSKKYNNELRGALFPNDKKGDVEKRPDYKGSAEVGGVKYWVAGWKKKSKQGLQFMSLKFEPQEKPEPEPDDDAPDLEDDDVF